MAATLKKGDVDSLGKAGQRVMELTVERASQEVLDTMRSLAPEGETGDLRRGLKRHRVDASTYLIVGESEHTGYVIEGTAPHLIEGDPLAFEVEGHTVFATVVHHPGTDPNPFHERALEAERPRIEGYASEAAATVRRGG